MIVAGELGVLGLNAQRHVEEELDTALGKLNKKHNMVDNHALEVPTEPFLVTNKAAQVIFYNIVRSYYSSSKFNST